MFKAHTLDHRQAAKPARAMACILVEDGARQHSFFLSFTGNWRAGVSALPVLRSWVVEGGFEDGGDGGGDRVDQQRPLAGGIETLRPIARPPATGCPWPSGILAPDVPGRAMSS